MQSDSNDDDLQSDLEDWNRPVDDALCKTVKKSPVTKHGPGKQANSSAVAAGDSLLVSKLGHQRTIIHIDIDCYYAQVEMIRCPELRSKPLGIKQKYLVVTCNYVARERGVTKLMGIKEAKEKCPDLVLVSGEDLTHYREMSYKISGDVSTAHEQLTKLAMSLFEKLVNVKQPFHLTLINVAFAKLEEKSSSDISSFFLPLRLGQQKQSGIDGVVPDYSPNEHLHQLSKDRSKEKIPYQATQSTDTEYKMEEIVHTKLKASDSVTDANRYVELVSGGTAVASTEGSCTTGPVPEKSLLGFFKKKQIPKNPNTVGSPDKTTLYSLDIDSPRASVDAVSSSSKMDTSSVSLPDHGRDQQDFTRESSTSPSTDVRSHLPDGIDPEVFSQLPPELQEDILGDFRSTRSRVYRSDQPVERAQRSEKQMLKSSKRQRKTSSKTETSAEVQLPGENNCGLPSCRCLETPEKGSEVDHLQYPISTDNKSVDDISPLKKKKRLFSPRQHENMEDSDANNNKPNRTEQEHSGIQNTEAPKQKSKDVSDSSSLKDRVASKVMSRSKPVHFDRPDGAAVIIADDKSSNNLVNSSSTSSILSSSSDTKHRPSDSSSASSISESMTRQPSVTPSSQFISDLPSGEIVPASTLDVDAKLETQFRCMTGPAPAVPPDMDEDVFRSLPAEIQAELSLQWQFQNIRKSNSTLSRASDLKKKSPKAPQKKTANHPTLFNFFRSKNK